MERLSRGVPELGFIRQVIELLARMAGDMVGARDLLQREGKVVVYKATNLAHPNTLRMTFCFRRADHHTLEVVVTEIDHTRFAHVGRMP